MRICICACYYFYIYILPTILMCTLNTSTLNAYIHIHIQLTYSHIECSSHTPIPNHMYKQLIHTYSHKHSQMYIHISTLTNLHILS